MESRWRARRIVDWTLDEFETVAVVQLWGQLVPQFAAGHLC